MSFSNDSCYNQIQETPTHVQQTKKEIIKLLDEVRVSLILTDVIIWAVPERVSSTLHTYRINLSPFTKDFRVWGVLIELSIIFLLEFLQRIPYLITLSEEPKDHTWIL